MSTSHTARLMVIRRFEHQCFSRQRLYRALSENNRESQQWKHQSQVADGRVIMGEAWRPESFCMCCQPPRA
jgi:hypothetical protein